MSSLEGMTELVAKQVEVIATQERAIAELQERMGALIMAKAQAEAQAWELSQAKTEDTVLLNWLDSQVQAYGTEGYHEGNRWMIDGPFRDLRHALRECKAYHDQCQAAQSAEKESGHAD